MCEERSTVKELISSLKQQRDELRRQIHLGSEEAKDQWETPDEKSQRLTSDWDPLKHAVDETAEDIWKSLKLVADESTNGFNRIRKSW